MQDPKAASGDLSTTTSPTKSSPPSSSSPMVNPNQITQNTSATGGGTVELKGDGGSSAMAGVEAGSSEVEGSVIDSDSVNLKRKWELRETPSGSPRCPECALEFPSWRSVFGHLRAHPDRNYRDNVEAGQRIDLNLEATEGEAAVKKEVELESTHTPMEGVERTSDAAAVNESESQEKRSGGAAGKENAMEGVEISSEVAQGKTDSSADHRGKRMKVAVAVIDEIEEELAPMEVVESTSKAKPAQKNETEAGSSSSSANKDERKKVFAFDLNELPPPDDEEDNVVP